MHGDLTEDQRLLQLSVERMVEDAVGRPAPAQTLWQAMIDGGWVSHALPHAAGGSDGDLTDIGLLMRAAGSRAVATPFFASAFLAGRLLASLDPASPLLPQVASGEVLLALGHGEGDEPDPRRPQTVAVRVAEGWAVNGRKRSVSGAAGATHLLISAWTDGGTALFLAPAGVPGIDIAPVRPLRDDGTGDIRIDIRMSEDGCIATGAEVGRLLSRGHEDAVIVLAWEAAGAMAALLERTIEHVRIRRQFGHSLSAFQVVQHRIAEMALACEEAQAIVHAASARMTGGERPRLATMVKIRVGRLARLVSEAAVQLHGAIGTTEELDVSRYFRLLLGFQLTFGSAEAQLGRHRSMIRDHSYRSSVIFPEAVP